MTSPYRLYSERLRDAEKAGAEDVYQYREISKTARVQIRQLMQMVFGISESHLNGSWRKNPAVAWAHRTLSHAQGRDHFGYSQTDNYSDFLMYLESAPTADFVNALEVACVAITQIVDRDPFWLKNWKPQISAESAIEQINFRMRDALFGFQFEQGQIIRIDSQFVHAEVTKPALVLLAQRGYEGPQAEFLAAHEHYRAGRNKEAITEAAKAFESLMKVVCDMRDWPYPKGARASDLIKILRTQNLWPDYLDGSFDQLLATLSSGLPKIRNDDAAHGQGSAPRTVPDYLASYALHLSAAKMVLIANAASV